MSHPRLTQSIERALNREQPPARTQNEQLEALLGLDRAPHGEQPRKERSPEQRRARRQFLRKQRAGAAERRAEAIANWGGDVRMLSGNLCKQTKGLRADEFYLDLGARVAEGLPKVSG